MQYFKHFLYALLLVCGFGITAAQSTTSADLAQTYMEARNAYDIDQTKSVLTDTAQILELGDDLSVEDLGSLFKYFEAAAFHWDVGDCTASEDASYELSCPFSSANAMTQALEINPVPGGTVSFAFADDKISAVNLDFPLDWWEPNVWRMFIAFVRANHAQDFQLMFTDRGLVGISDEGLALWENHIEEFTQVMETARANPGISPSEQVGLEFLEARDKWDAEALFSLLADSFESYDLQRVSTLEDYQDAMAYYQALNWNWTAERCDDIGQRADVYKVLCVSELTNDLTRGLDNGGYNMGWGLEIENGKIIGIYPEWNRAFVDNNLQPFRGYLLKNHPNDYPKIYPETSSFLPRGEEALTLLKRYVAEFLADQN